MPKLTNDAEGVHVIAPTPFDEKGALDLASTARMVERYLAMGASGLTILGMMGEAPKLFVSTMSAPAAKNPRCTSRTRSGRERLRRSVQFSRPQ